MPFSADSKTSDLIVGFSTIVFAISRMLIVFTPKSLIFLLTSKRLSAAM
jgi:hypothetical protein